MVSERRLDVSVIVPARNAAATIGDQLEALSQQVTGRSWEVIVVDNDSDDDTLAVAEQYRDRFARFSALRADDVRGSGHARNTGAAHASGCALLFCDADDVVTSGWIDALTGALARYDAVGGPLDEATLNDTITRAMRHPLVTDELPLVMGFRRAVTSNCAVRADVFESLGGFDETYPASIDTEFFIRLQVMGHSLGFTPDAVVQLRHGDDVRTILRKLYRWDMTRPRLYAQYRRHGATRNLWLGPAKWAWLLACSFYLILSREKRMRWLAIAVRSYGRVVGSARHRTLFL